MPKPQLLSTVQMIDFIYLYFIRTRKSMFKLSGMAIVISRIKLICMSQIGQEAYFVFGLFYW